MRIRLLVVTLLLTVSLAYANDVETQFNAVKKSFTERQKTAKQDLRQYLKDFPYTTYESEVHLMTGILNVEGGKYKTALKSFEKVKMKQLEREQQPMFYFYRGYAFMQMKDMHSAVICFKALRDSDNPYTLQGKYYFAYCEYIEGNYQLALKDFLEIEHTSQYQKIVPYYIIQIYYAQHDYDEVYDRARYLLEVNPDNENNSEIHRILGEIYYNQGQYEVAANNLEECDKMLKQRSEELPRNDLYLLGIAQYRLERYTQSAQTLKRIPQKMDTISENTFLYLGHAYVKVHDIENAKLAYQAAIEYNISPNVREEAMYNYALCTYESGTALGEGVNAFNNFLSEYPNTVHAEYVYQLLADMYMSSKNYQAALEAIDKMSTSDKRLQKTKQYLRYQLGADAFLQGKMLDAKNLMSEVIANENGTSDYKTEAFYYRAEAEYRLHEYENCYNDLETYLHQANVNKSSNKQNVEYLKGYSLFSLKQYSEAEVAFRKFITTVQTSSPLYADALNRIGDCCFNNRAFSEAEKTYAQVANMNGAGADYATFQRGYALGLMHKYSDKADVMEHLVEAYPKSDYADDALYEIARAHLQEDENTEAANAYRRLVDRYPNSNYARKASLELGMVYRNLQKYPEAVSAFKQTIQKFPGSEEAYSALDGLEQVYVETNNIAEYLNYTKQLGKMNMAVSNQDDSLTYVTAELQYMLGNYREAAAGLSTYLSQYCSGGRYCTMATYYAADSYYRINHRTEALDLYKKLAEINGNPYMEETCSRIAEITYDNKDYKTARTFFKRLEALSGQNEINMSAKLGILRCNYFLHDTDATIDIATKILSDDKIPADVRDEALYNRAKAYYESSKYGLAIVDLTPLAKDVRIETGAEAKYLLADCYYKLGAMDDAESEIMSFASQRTQHQYWLAKSLILLSDINMNREETFQAKQYLLTLKNNYQGTDDILTIVEQKLQTIEKKENEQAQNDQEEEEDEL